MSYSVRQHVYRDPHTFVEIEATVSVGKQVVKLTGQGFAKRNACDAPNRSIGYEVAIARAIEDLRRQRARVKQTAVKRAIHKSRRAACEPVE